MSDASRLLAALLAPAVAAARAALRRLDPDEVPATVRRVAAYSGGRLPPPLTQSLLDELDTNEWLRGKAHDELAEGDGPGQLFLERPPGWARELAEAAAARAAGDVADERAAAVRRAEEAEQKLGEARRRLREERRAPAAATGAGEVAELRRKLKEAHRRAAADVARLEAAVGAAEAHAAEGEETVAALAGEVQRLRRELRRARRERAALEAAAQGASGGVLRRRPPIELARDLDVAARLMRPAPAAPGEPVERPAAPRLVLPAGVRPDEAAAVDWLVERTDPALLLVDGYNVTFTLSERGFATPEARSRLNAELARLARRSAALRVTVVYDSDQDLDTSATAGPGGVEVVFAPADRLADEELVARAAGAALPAVVVSTDREVREGAEEAGALALWGEALVGWLRRRT